MQDYLYQAKNFSSTLFIGLQTIILNTLKQANLAMLVFFASSHYTAVHTEYLQIQIKSYCLFSIHMYKLLYLYLTEKHTF